MTIAICCSSSEGVVIGVDSATTVQPSLTKGLEIAIRHLNHAQKLFEVGDKHSYGPLMIATYGLGSFGKISHRTMVAEFADILEDPGNHNKTIDQVAELWSDHVWLRFTTELAGELALVKSLDAKLPFPAPGGRTEQEESVYASLTQLTGGYFLAGRRHSDRATQSYVIEFSWNKPKQPAIKLTPGAMYMAGYPFFIQRITDGIDPRLTAKIASDPRWTGTEADLKSLAGEFNALHAYELPIRDLVEKVYSFVYCTIKSVRFSPLAPLCGGPIEIATITTDRPFRWVNHKNLDVAIHQSLFNETRHA